MFTFSTLLSRSPVAGHADKEQLQVSGWQTPGKKSSGESGGGGVENAQEKTAVQVAQDGTDDTVVTGVTQKSSRINSHLFIICEQETHLFNVGLCGGSSHWDFPVAQAGGGSLSTRTCVVTMAGKGMRTCTRLPASPWKATAQGLTSRDASKDTEQH